MLILTRKLGENIRIGDDVRIVILDIKGGQVKIGIEAPPDVSVHREEIYERIRVENQRAGGIAPDEVREAAEILRRQRRVQKRRDQRNDDGSLAQPHSD